MAYSIRRSQERGSYDYGWLKTFHTFSFNEYYDPKFMGFRTLRVINEDRVQPHRGFPLHAHQDMEIITIVIEGELTHQDSLGNTSTISSGEVQIMSAGTGVTHSEYNHSDSMPVHFFQIWIYPDKKSLTPKYQQKKFKTDSNTWQLIASKNSRDNSLIIHQDAEVYLAHIDQGQKVDRQLPEEKHGWLQMISGELNLNDIILRSGDGISFTPNTQITLKAVTPSEILFFELR